MEDPIVSCPQCGTRNRLRLSPQDQVPACGKCKNPLPWIIEGTDISFRKELEHLLNRHSQENGCNTPDFILADYLANCLRAFDTAVNARERWYSRPEGWRKPMQPIEMDWLPSDHPGPSNLTPPPL